jgi:hypothetical protein
MQSPSNPHDRKHEERALIAYLEGLNQIAGVAFDHRWSFWKILFDQTHFHLKSRGRSK